MAILTALCASIADLQAWDDSKYPDLKGQWMRGPGGGARYDWSKPPGRGQEAPLTPEYQAIYEATLADQAAGGQGGDPTYRCLSPGMPRIMHVYAPMEIIVTPETTHILIEHIHDSRRIHTDGRDWPDDMYENPMFRGYSIGKWIDTDGDGKFDVLEVETRGIKNPRTYDPTGIPFHADGRTIVKERFYLDKNHANLLHLELTTIDNALTRPWCLPVGRGTARQAGLGAVERLWICDFPTDSTTAWNKMRIASSGVVRVGIYGATPGNRYKTGMPFGGLLATPLEASEAGGRVLTGSSRPAAAKCLTPAECLRPTPRCKTASMRCGAPCRSVCSIRAARTKA
jgi:hypothetical protein